MKKLLVFIGAAAFLLSCGPSVNPQLRAKLDPLFSGGPSKNYGSGRRFTRPMAYAVGQYVVHGTVDGDGKKSVSKTSIVGREEGGWIIESYSLDDTKESISQMLIVGLDSAAKTGNVDGVEIRWVKFQDDQGAIQTIEGPMLMMMKSLYRGSLSAFKVKTSSFIDGGAVEVPAGTFTGTNRIDAEATFFGRTYKSTGWHHSGVPINGLVKSVSDDGENKTVLLRFGTRGAVAELK